MSTRVCVNCGQHRNLGSFGGSLTCRPCRRQREYAEKPFSHLFWRCTERAKRKQQEIDIDAEFLEQLWLAQDGKCYWSKQPLTLDFGNHSLSQASVDRLDNSKGYTRDNVVLVSLAMNHGRNSAPVETWLEYLNSLGILGLFSFVKSA